jgi:uncharacterized damage-inducible protein DinB
VADIDEHGRSEPPHDGNETATLLGFLDYQRATLAWKCDGLSDEQLRIALSPSSLTLGGLLKHMALVEDNWFSRTLAEQPLPELWTSVDWNADPDWELTSAAANPGETLRSLWAARVEASRAVVACELEQHGTDALGRTHPHRIGPVSLRWILTHMIEEYARHNGHADFLREYIDGVTGE